MSGRTDCYLSQIIVRKYLKKDQLSSLDVCNTTRTEEDTNQRAQFFKRTSEYLREIRFFLTTNMFFNDNVNKLTQIQITHTQNCFYFL